LNLSSTFYYSVSAYICGGGEKDCEEYLFEKGRNGVVLEAGRGYNSFKTGPLSGCNLRE
jgi:hypothetical protein